MEGDKILALHLKSCLIGAVPHMDIHVGIALLVRTNIKKMALNYKASYYIQ